MRPDFQRDFPKNRGAAARLERAALAPEEEKVAEAWPGLRLVYCWTGATAGLYGVYIAFGMVFAENELFMFPLPFAIKAKYFVWILIVITLALSLSQGPAVSVLLPLKKKMCARSWDCLRNWARRGRTRTRGWMCQRSNRD